MNLLHEPLLPITIRKVEEGDLVMLRGESEAPYLQFLYNTAYQGMKRGEQMMWVVEAVEEGIIGHIFVQFKSLHATLADGTERAYFYSFHVYSDHRSKGVGTYLLRFLEGDLRKRGFQIVTLTVEKENKRARRFYERNGYLVAGTEVVNVRSDHVNGKWERTEKTAWRMEKRIL